MISIMTAKFNIQLPEPLDQLNTRAIHYREFTAGQTLFRQGDKSRGLFYVIDGAMELRRVTEVGHDVLMFRATSGDTFAEASLFHTTYHCDAIATERSQIIECSRNALHRLYRTDIKFALSMSERFATQIQQCRMRMELLSIKSAEERVYRAIVEGMLRGSARSLASEIGLSAEAVYRALGALSKSGRIQKSGYGQYTSN